MKLGVGIVGVGAMGRRHAENILALGHRATLVAVADTDEATARSVGAAYDVPWSRHPDDVFSRPDIQAVVIATGVNSHAELVRQAAGQGKDILCEKPLALTLDDAEKAVAAAHRAGVRLQIAFMRRFDPAYHQAYEAIQRGDIGTPLVLTAISRDAAPPPRSDFLKYSAAGVFIDSGNHDFDLAPWLMQDEVVGVSASGAVVASHDLTDVQPIDVGLATLEFRSGGLGSLQIYRNAVYGYDVRTEVLGTDGAVMIGDTARQGYRIMHRGRSTQQLTTHWLDRFADAYRLEMADWVERTIAERPPAVPGEAGVRAVRLALAAEQARLSGKVVRV